MKEKASATNQKPYDPKTLLGIEVLLSSLFINILGLAVPLFVIQVLNRYIAHGIDGTLVALASGALLAVGLEFCFRTVRTRLAGCASATVNRTLAERSFQSLVNIRGQILLNIPSRMRSEIMQGLEAVQQATSASNITSLMDVPFAFFYILTMYLLSPVLASLAVFFITLAFLVGLWSIRSTKGDGTELARELSNKRALLQSATTSGVDTIRAFDGQKYMMHLWRTIQTKTERLTNALQNQQGLAQNITQVITACMTVAIISVGAKLSVSGELNIGIMMGANILAARALMPISKLAQLGQSIAKSRVAMQQLEKFNNMPRELEKGTELKTYQGGLELMDLSYTYPGSPQPLFESFSLKLPHGSIVAVVGQNGSGKTTLARLLMGLLDPSRGRIMADGVDLRQISPWWWRQNVSYLPQEPVFMDGTVQENILLGSEGISQDKLNAIIEISGLKAWVSHAAQGMDELITDNGRHLSLGIRRRIALARCLTTDGRLLVFDEPTEGLDFSGQKSMYAVLSLKLKQGCTVICFSHDPGILSYADYLVDLNAKPVPRIGMNKKKTEDGFPSDVAPSTEA